jgi:uncharacterized protein YggU (UPF0235/DUF167 family)
VTQLRIDVRVTARAGRDEVAGDGAGGLLVRVAAAPEAGRANTAVCALVAKALGVPKSAVQVVSGRRSRHKVLEVTGPVDAGALERLGRTET